MELLTNGISTLGFSIPIITELCFFLDSIIYGVATAALNTFFELASLTANVTAYSNQIEYILKRLMMLAGVYALFRGSIMLINYIIDPNKIKNASKDGGSIVKNIVLAVVLLIATPFIFKQLGRLQGMIIDQNVIPKLIYGSTGEGTNDVYEMKENNIPKQSKIFVNNVFLLFLSQKEGYGCENNRGWQCSARNEVANGNADILSLVTTTSYFDYTPFISGIVGMVLVYYFTIFAIEIGTRILKLVILQVVSPIPIIMSVDPSQKNKLSNFVKAYGVLYIQIFLRILTLYLAFVVLSLITDPQDVVSNGMIGSNGLLLASDLGMYATILLYIGVFQATKELPKLIEDALGIKIGSTGAPQSFGAVLKGIIGGTAGLVGGTVAGAVSGGVGGAIAGGLSGMVGAGMGAAASKNTAAGIKSAVASIGKSHQLGGKVAGAGGLPMYFKGGVENFFGAKGKDEATLAQFDKQLKDQDKLIGDYNNEIGNINKGITTRNTADQYRNKLEQVMEKSFADSAPGRKSIQDYMENDVELNKLQDAIKSNSARRSDGSSFYDVNPEYRQIDLNRVAERKAELVEKFAQEKRDYMEGMFVANRDPNDSGYNVEFETALKDYNDYVTSHDMSDRVIESYSGTTDGMENASNMNEQDRVQYEKDIKEQEDKIKSAEDAKKQIENERKAFENNPRTISHQRRDEKPKSKPWNNQ